MYTHVIKSTTWIVFGEGFCVSPLERTYTKTGARSGDGEIRTKIWKLTVLLELAFLIQFD